MFKRCLMFHTVQLMEILQKYIVATVRKNSVARKTL